jgi:phosphoribosylamine--glycine ligase
MGVVCPASDVGPELLARIDREIVAPTLAGMKAEGHPFRGVLFAGIMITPEGDPMLLEHNVRFGDPECEALMELCEGDVAGLLASAARGELDPHAVSVRHDRHAVVVVLAAKGYPAAPETGAVITGLDEAAKTGARVHHAGTRAGAHGLEVGGGRVLAVTASGATYDEARATAYRAADAIHFDGKQLRRDIGETVPREGALG